MLPIEDRPPGRSGRLIRFKQKFWLIPLLGAALIPVVCLVPYAIAVAKGQINPIFPLISDAGSVGLPSAHIFSQLFDILAIVCKYVWLSILGLSFPFRPGWLDWLCAWIRYKQTLHYLTSVIPDLPSSRSAVDISLLHRLNCLATISLVLAGFGHIMVGNFRSSEELLFHFIGVLLIVNRTLVCSVCWIILWKALARAGIESPPRALLTGYVAESIFGTLLLCHLAIMATKVGADLLDFQQRIRFSDYQSPIYWWYTNTAMLEWFIMFCHAIPFFCLANRFRAFKNWHLVAF